MSQQIKRCQYDNPEKWQRELWRDGEIEMTISGNVVGTDFDTFLDPVFRGEFCPGRIVGYSEAMQPRKDNGAND